VICLVCKKDLGVSHATSGFGPYGG
jgi:hypothetical protein